MRIDEARSAGFFVDRHARAVQGFAAEGMRSHVVDDLAHAREQSGILKYGFAYSDPVPTELTRLPEQPGSLGQGAHGDWSVVGCHATERIAGDERSPRTELGRTPCGHDTRRSSANDYDICHFGSP